MMTSTLSQQLEEFLAGWKQRVPPNAKPLWSGILPI